MKVPAFCDSCGAIFPSGIEANNAVSIGFSSVGSGPCPNCGGTGHIPDGLYNFVNGTIELLSGPSRTVSELQRLADILSSAKKKNATPQEVFDEIDKELPDLSSIKKFLPQSRRMELYAVIGIILTIIGLLIKGHDTGTPKIDIDQVINITYQQGNVSSPDLPIITNTQINVESKRRKKIGRNEPCPCGSGKKYKKCCGK